MHICSSKKKILGVFVVLVALIVGYFEYWMYAPSGYEIPIHFFRYHPTPKWVDPETLQTVIEQFEKLKQRRSAQFEVHEKEGLVVTDLFHGVRHKGEIFVKVEVRVDGDQIELICKQNLITLGIFLLPGNYRETEFSRMYNSLIKL